MDVLRMNDDNGMPTRFGTAARATLAVLGLLLLAAMLLLPFCLR